MIPSPLYLLDTNILVHFVRADDVWTRIRSLYPLFAIDPRPLISIVTAGEIRSLALQWNWRSQKLDQMEFALDYFDKMPIDDDPLVNAYALIDAHFQRQGRAFGKNDLWIAATAQALDARLLTADRDFDAMDPLFISRDWIDSTPKP